jgi:predicted nucleic acid-binding protein
VNTTYLLDANAVLDFLENGSGAERVERLLTGALQGDSSVILISVVNWGEVFYHSWQERGEEFARKTISNLSRLPIETVPVDQEQSLKAGELKARHRIPYVDCLAAALAIMRRAVLVTSDRDFEKLGRRVQVFWTRHR